MSTDLSVYWIILSAPLDLFSLMFTKHHILKALFMFCVQSSEFVKKIVHPKCSSEK